jgi:cobaltochelatase CobS
MANAIEKKITVRSVQGAYDLALAHFQANPDLITADVTPEEHVLTVMEMKLTEMNYQRATNTVAVLKSHEAKLKRDGGNRLAAADADAVVAQIFKQVTGVELDIPAPQAQEDDSVAHSPSTKGVKTSDNVAPTTDPVAAPVVARVEVGVSYTVQDGGEALINPTISAATGNQIASIGDLLNAVLASEEASIAVDEIAENYRTAINAYGAGESDVDESTLVDVTKYNLSGFAGTPTNSPMVPVLDNQLASMVSPATTFANLVGRVDAAENAIVASTADVKSLKRDLRRARPKTSVKMSIKTQATATAETLSEVDEINADCEVVNEMASDLFPEVYGNNSQILGFEVPKLDFGVGHPDVPEPDSSFRFYTAVLAEALHAIAENEIIWLHGHSGCGKSEFWPQVAARLNMPFTRVNLDGHLTRSDIVGGMKLVSDGKGGSETRFIEGALPRAMSRPGILLLDEFDCGDPEIMPIFQPVLEGKPIVLLEDGGRIVYPHPMFRIAITGNSTGLGSESQMYLNVHEQSAATRDRISAFVEMPYMPAKIEKEVIMARMPDADEDFVEKLIGLANKVREGFAKDEIFTLFSTRAVQYCARRHIRFAPLYATPEEASHEVLKTVILNRLDPASHSKVKELVDAMFI